LPDRKYTGLRPVPWDCHFTMRQGQGRVLLLQVTPPSIDEGRAGRDEVRRNGHGADAERLTGHGRRQRRDQPGEPPVGP